MEVFVTDIQRFCTHDGPGIRTTVFFKGCPLRCAWCHNPETQSMENEILYRDNLCIGCAACVQVCPQGAHCFGAGTHEFDVSRCKRCMACAAVCPAKAIEQAAHKKAPSEILSEVMRDLDFYGSAGGITLSGGEPLLHWEESLSLLGLAKEANISTAVETCGYFHASMEAMEKLVHVTDLFLWDFKDSDSCRHARMTGVYPQRIMENLRIVDSLGGVTRLRCILVKDINLNASHAEQVAGQYHRLTHCQGVELLAYHAYGGSKRVHLGYQDNGRPDWIPKKEELYKFRLLLEEYGVPVWLEE